MARVDTKTIAALAVLGLAGANYTQRTGERGSDKSAEHSISRKAYGAARAEVEATSVEVREEFENFLNTAKIPGHQIHYVVATVPDPDKTALRLYTDRVLDVLMLAAFEHGFVLIKQWVPWKFSLERPDEDYSERRLQRAEFLERAKYPGVLVFEVGDHILLILLVPETPTAGINRDVLDKAITLLKPGSAPLIGPSFTGGLESLSEWLHLRSINTQAISHIVTGSVTGLKEAQAKLYPNEKGIPFHWTRRQRYETDYALQKFLKKTRPCLDTIVQLAEDSTGFGRAVVEMHRQTNDCGKPQPQNVQFPWQISRVRNAMPEVGISARAPTANVFNLPLQLRETRRPEGAMPTYAGEQTPAAQEVVLAQITTGLERQPAEYVSVVATDILDSLFLVRLLRMGNPSQRVIVNDPDLLFLRAQDTVPTIGLLAATSFPQSNHLRLRDAQIPALTTKVFDSEFAASIFVAARDAIPDLLGSHAVHESGQITKRALWLVTLGRNGYWPVARLDDVQTAASTSTVLPDKPTLAWFALFSAVLCAAILWLVILSAARRHWLTGFDDLQVKFSWPDPEQRALTLTVLTSAATIFFAIAAMPVWFPLRQDTQLDDRRTVAFWTGLLLFTFAAFVPWARLRQHLSNTIGLCLIAAAPLVVILVTWGIFRRAQDDYLLWRFFLVRSQDYLNGVGPLLPFCLLLLGFIGCAWSSHIATVLSTERFIRLGGLPGYPGDCRKRFNRHTFLAAFVLSAIVFFATAKQLHSLEPRIYDLIYSCLLSMLLVWVLYTCFNFLDRWRSLRQFLMRLELHPIRLVFSALPNDDGAPIWESHPRRRSMIFYGRTADCLRRLQQLAPTEQVKGAIDSLDAFLQSTRSGRGAHRRLVEEQLSNLLQMFELDLNRTGGPWLAGNSDLIAAPDQIPQDKLKQEFITLRLAAYFRCCFLHIRNRLTAMSAGFVAMTLSLNSYAFGPERVIQVFTIGLVIFIGGVVISVFAQMHQNPLLLRMSGKSTGAMDWSFWSKVISAGALPVISLLASYTPSIGKLLSNWLQPALEAMGK